MPMREVQSAPVLPFSTRNAFRRAVYSDPAAVRIRLASGSTMLVSQMPGDIVLIVTGQPAGSDVTWTARVRRLGNGKFKVY